MRGWLGCGVLCGLVTIKRWDDAVALRRRSSNYEPLLLPHHLKDTKHTERGHAERAMLSSRALEWRVHRAAVQGQRCCV